jgi:hypothetical protein
VDNGYQLEKEHLTMAVSPKGIRYPLSSDHKRLWEHFQNMALDVDGHVPTLIDTSDGGFPLATSATSSEVVIDRITVASVAYDRLLVVTGSEILAYSQADQTIDLRIYVNSTRIALNRHRVLTATASESYGFAGQFLLPASTTGVAEARMIRTTGTGAVTNSAADCFFQVSWRRA